jgi:hypothetical protein
LVLISGEPGIGKTRCAEAVAELAEDQGALVLWGRCHEEAGAPPYWPWVQSLRAYVAASSLDEVRLNMGTAANDIAFLKALAGRRFDRRAMRLRVTLRDFVPLTRSASFLRPPAGAQLVLDICIGPMPLPLLLEFLTWSDS